MDNYYEDLIQGKARAAAKKMQEKDPELARRIQEHLAPAKEEKMSSENLTEDMNLTPYPQLKLTKEMLREAAKHEKSLKRGVPPEDQ